VHAVSINYPSSASTTVLNIDMDGWIPSNARIEHVRACVQGPRHQNFLTPNLQPPTAGLANFAEY
jgi:hypothetical protein